MNRTIPTLITAGALALTLTACSGSNDTAAPETTVVTVTGTPEDSPAETTEAAPERNRAELGDVMTLDCDAEYPCDVDVTVTEITTSKECHDGVADYVNTLSATPDTTYVKVTGEMDPREYTWSDTYSILDHEWIPVDEDGYELPLGPAFDCNGDPAAGWDSPVQVGNKARAVQEYAVQGEPFAWTFAPTRDADMWQFRLNP